MATPIGYQKIQTSGGIVSVPIYALTDIADNFCRIQLNGQVGCYDLVTPTSSTPLRINTQLGIKGINLNVAPEVNQVDWNSGAPTNPSVVTTVSSDANETHLITTGNGHGFVYDIADLTVDEVYNVEVNVELLDSVDDLITIHIRNVTQSKYIKTSVATSTFQIGGKQKLTGTFTPTASNYTVGDTIQMQVVQSWRNSTHDDPFEFKIFSDIFTIY